MTGVLIGRGNLHRGTSCEDTARKRPRQATKKDLGRNQTYQHMDLGLLVSRIVRKQISVV